MYWKETLFTLYQRRKEHWSTYLEKSDKSALCKHKLLEHPENLPDWKIKVYDHQQRPRRRQVDEGVLINNALVGELINSTSEITRGGEIPRLVITLGEKEYKGTDSDKQRCPAKMQVATFNFCYAIHYLNNKKIFF